MKKGLALAFYISLIFTGNVIQAQVTVLSENFNGPVIPAGWSKFNNSTGGNPAEAEWTLRPDGYVYSSFIGNFTFHSNDNSQFYLSNSDAQGDDTPPPTTNTILQSPAFSTMAYTNLSLKFYHNFWSFGSADTALVEVSTNGTSWVPAYTAHEDTAFEIGSSGNFILQTVNLNAFIGNASVRIRFHYFASFGFYWAIDNVTVIGNSPLSANLISFSGYRGSNRNILQWVTANEQNNRGFRIERSTDGINYTAAGFVNSLTASGNSSVSLNYTFIDNNIGGSIQYYRLRQFDFDGHELLSKIVIIKSTRSLDLAITGLFPNPSSTTLNVIINTAKPDNIMLWIMNANGSIIKQQKAVVSIGSNTIPINLTALATGSYLLKIISSSGNESVTGKFIKQ